MAISHRPIEQDHTGCWQIKGYQEAKILFNSNVTQAGFGTEKMKDQRRFMTPPIPAIDGEEHRERRSQIAKFFTPSTTNKQYRGLIKRFVEETIADFPVNVVVDFKDLATQVASSVVCEIVGLTHSIRSGIEDRFLYVASNHDVGKLSLSPGEIYKFLNAARSVLGFWIYDIRPAIRAHKAEPKHDLISHMLEQDRNSLTILIECITYGIAGILTTREFMCSALELCLQNPEYRELMGQDDQEIRTRFLYEVLRLNPVTSHLTRRAAEDIQVHSDGQTFLIKKGELMVFNIFEIDTDPRALGKDALTLRPDRPYESRIMWSMLAFGFGAHRCPGEALAILETDIFLQELLPLDIEVLNYPTRGFNDPSKTNELYNFKIRRCD